MEDSGGGCFSNQREEEQTLGQDRVRTPSLPLASFFPILSVPSEMEPRQKSDLKENWGRGLDKEESALHREETGAVTYAKHLQGP